MATILFICWKNISATEEDVGLLCGALVPEIAAGRRSSIAHLHLAEAVLVMHEGGPLHTQDILKEIDLPQEVNPRLQTFSLDYALFHDDRFDEVGPAGKVLWYLRELEPEEVMNVPERLRYTSSSTITGSCFPTN